MPPLQEARRLVGAGRRLRARGEVRRRRRRHRARGEVRGRGGGAQCRARCSAGRRQRRRQQRRRQRGRAAAGVRRGGSAGRDAGRACASSTLGPSPGPLGRRPWLVGALNRSLHWCCCLAGAAAATSAATGAAGGVRRGGASLRLCPAQPSRVAGTRGGGHPAGPDRISRVMTEARASSACSAPRRRRPSRLVSLARYTCVYSVLTMRDIRAESASQIMHAHAHEIARGCPVNLFCFRGAGRGPAAAARARA